MSQTSNTNHNAGSNTSIAVTLGTTPTAGDLLVVVLGFASGTAQKITVLDGNNNRFTVMPNSPSLNSTAVTSLYMAYLVVPSSPSPSATITASLSFASSYISIIVDEFVPSGGVPVFDFDAFSQNVASSGGASTSPSVSPSAGELLYAGMMPDTASTVTAPAPGGTLGGWTGSSRDSGQTICSEYIASSSAGSVSVSFTNSNTTGPYTSGVMVFKLASTAFWMRTEDLCATYPAATPATMTIPLVTPQTGDTIVFGLIFDGNPGTLTVQDPTSGTNYTVSPSSPSTPLYSYIAFVAKAPSGIGQTATATWSNSGIKMGAEVVVFYSSGGTPTFDTDAASVSKTADGSGNVTDPSITPRGAGELLCGLVNPSTSIGAPAIYKLLGGWVGAGIDSGTGMAMEYILSCAAGATNAAYTDTAANDQIGAVIVAFYLSAADDTYNVTMRIRLSGD